MKKINSARKPIPTPLTKTAIVYGMGIDNPERYVFMPDVVFLDEFREPTPLHVTKAMIKAILDMRVDK